MTGVISARHSATRISDSVKWCDPARGYGVLEPHDGSPDILCREPALGAVGLETLLAGATVDCETEQGLRGPEVSQIRAVYFSSASLRPQPVDGAQPDRPQPPAPALSGSSRPLRATVKWFLPVKGCGFLEPEDGSLDVFGHVSAVEALGRDTLPQGAVVTCETVQSGRGPRYRRSSRSRRRPSNSARRPAPGPSTPGIRDRTPAAARCSSMPACCSVPAWPTCRRGSASSCARKACRAGSRPRTSSLCKRAHCAHRSRRGDKHE